MWMLLAASHTYRALRMTGSFLALKLESVPDRLHTQWKIAAVYR